MERTPFRAARRGDSARRLVALLLIGLGPGMLPGPMTGRAPLQPQRLEAAEPPPGVVDAPSDAPVMTADSTATPASPPSGAASASTEKAAPTPASTEKAAPTPASTEKAAPAPAEPPSSPPADQPGKPAAPGEPAIIIRPATDLGLVPIHFPAGQARLGIDTQAVLELIAQLLVTSHPQSRVRIEGRTDGREPAPGGSTPEARRALSMARAEVVRDFLVGRGVPGDRLVVVALADSEPIGTLSSPRDEERNRVVTFSFIEAKGPATAVATSAGSGAPASRPGVPETTGGAPAQPAGSSPSGAAAPASPDGPSPGSPPAGSGTGRPAQMVAVTVQETPRAPVEVESIRLGLKILKREGKGAWSRDPWPIQEFLQDEMSEIERRYRAALRNERGLAGETRFSLSITAEGEVTDAQVQLPVPQDDFRQSLVTYFKGWTLPPPPGDGEMRVEMVLTVYATFRAVLTPGR